MLDLLYLVELREETLWSDRDYLANTKQETGAMTTGAERDTRISIRVRPQELSFIKKNAQLHGLTVAGYLRAIGTNMLLQPNEVSDGRGKPDADTLELLIKNFALFSSLSEEELIQSLDKIQIRHFAKKEIVLDHANVNQFMYVILSGAVKVHISNEEGREVILAIHKTGDFFGEMSLIDGNATSATVTASDDSTIAIIAKKDFHSLILTQQKILFGLLQTFCQRIRASNITIEIMSHTCASYRVKMLLIVLAGKHGVSETGGMTLPIPLTQQDIANMTGLGRETVSRVMADLRSKGEIMIQENRLIHLKTPFFNETFEVCQGSRQ